VGFDDLGLVFWRFSFERFVRVVVWIGLKGREAGGGCTYIVRSKMVRWDVCSLHVMLRDGCHHSMVVGCYLRLPTVAKNRVLSVKQQCGIPCSIVFVLDQTWIRIELDACVWVNSYRK